MSYSFTIPAGTKVLSNRRGMVTLCADAHIDNATRDVDGCYRYTLDRETYLASAGTVEHVHKSSSDEVLEHEGTLWRHRDGLVWLGG